MQGTEEEHRGALLSVAWEDDVPPGADDQSLEQASAYAAVLVRTLSSAGYQPRCIQMSLRRGISGTLALRVLGDVPGIPEADFLSLAQVTLTSTMARLATNGTSGMDLQAGLAHLGPPPGAELGLHAALETNGVSAHPRPAALPAKHWTQIGPVPVGRLAIGLLLGLTLGVVGLPRLELSLPSLQLPGSSPQAARTTSAGPATTLVPDQPPAAIEPTPIQPTPIPVTTILPTLIPVTPIPLTPNPAALIASRPPRVTATPIDGPATSGARVLFAQKLLAPVPSWPDDPSSNAWFADGVYRLFARQPGRFVAVGVPLPVSVGDAVLSAQFHKISGPAGGGYGLIVRDQGPSGERDSRNQSGRYVVLEVGDKGDIGIWQREQSRWIDILPWTHSEAIRPGLDSNRLVITAEGPTLRFEVNGATLADVDYTGLPPTGGVGVFVGGDLNEVALEWLRVESK